MGTTFPLLTSTHHYNTALTPASSTPAPPLLTGIAFIVPCRPTHATMLQRAMTRTHCPTWSGRDCSPWPLQVEVHGVREDKVALSQPPGSVLDGDHAAEVH